MAKYTCLNCAHYRPPQTISDGMEHIGEGVYTPKYKRVEHKCVKNTKAFNKFWKENGCKPVKDIVFGLNCFEPNKHMKQLDELLNLTNDILQTITGHGKEKE